MKILTLSDVPDAIPALARWFHAEWYAYDGRSVPDIETQLAGNLNRDTIPITFVARREAVLLGTVSLDLSDLPPFDHFSPWLASLYVCPAARGQGVGTALVRHLLDFASSRGIAPLYLWTPGSTRLYRRCGWRLLERTYYKSKPIALMRFAGETAPLTAKAC